MHSLHRQRSSACLRIAAYLLIGLGAVVAAAQTSGGVTSRQAGELIAKSEGPPSLALKAELVRSTNAHRLSPALLEAALDFHYERAHGKAAASAALPWALPLRSISGRSYVTVDAVAGSPEDAERLVAALEGLGLLHASSYQRVVSGVMPVDRLTDAADVPGLQSMRAAAARVHVGLVDSQGDVAMNADLARATFGVDGSGVLIGTLSDSFDCLGGAAGDVASGDLPPGILVLDDGFCTVGSGTDEGRGMMQLIADVAPGAAQAFHTAFLGTASFANGILELRQAGADIIVDDIGILNAPFFQNGIVAQAVNTVVADGAAYFSAAGNAASVSYESAYRPSGVNPLAGILAPSYEAHDFDPGPGVDVFQRIRFDSSVIRLTLEWDEPAAAAGGLGATSDLDFFIFDDPPVNLLVASTELNVATGDPIEFLPLSGPTNTAFNVVIAKNLGQGGADPGLIKYINFLPMTFLEFDTSSSTIIGHPNTFGGEAVGAAFYQETPPFGVAPPLLEPFSSTGGTPILFDDAGNRLAQPLALLKPNLVGPDGTNTTFFGGNDVEGDGFPNFFGTSAAAPHVAAVAALLLESNPALSSFALYTPLEGTAVEMGAPGLDFESGFGLVDASPSVAAATSPPDLEVLANGAPAAGGLTVAAGPAVFFNAVASDGDGLGFPIFARAGNPSPVSHVWDFDGAQGQGPLSVFVQRPTLRFALNPGENERVFDVAVSVIDTLGGTSAANTPVTVVAPTPPNVAATVNGGGGPVTVAAGVTAFFEVVADDTDGLGYPIFGGFDNFSPVRFLWNFGGGVAGGPLQAFAPRPSASFGLDPGEGERTFDVTVSAFDTLGASAADGLELTVVQPTPPIVTLLADGSVAGASLDISSGTTVAFNVTTTDSDGLGYPIFGGFGNFSLVTFLWNFGGAPAPNPLAIFARAPRVTFTLAPGETGRTFDVRLTVFDRFGASTRRELAVNVTP